MVMMMTTRQRCINKEQGRGRLLHFRWTWTFLEGKVMILIINFLNSSKMLQFIAQQIRKSCINFQYRLLLVNGFEEHVHIIDAYVRHEYEKIFFICKIVENIPNNWKHGSQEKTIGLDFAVLANDGDIIPPSLHGEFHDLL